MSKFIYRLKIAYYMVTLAGVPVKSALSESRVFALTSNPRGHVTQNLRYWINTYSKSSRGKR